MSAYTSKQICGIEVRFYSSSIGFDLPGEDSPRYIRDLPSYDDEIVVPIVRKALEKHLSELRKAEEKVAEDIEKTFELLRKI